jgi:hypothetical protein
MPQQDPALAILEMHRSAHAALQQSQHSFATVHVPTAKEISDEYADRRVRLQANRELTAAIPAAKRLNIIYAPLLAKTLCSDLCETISGFLRDNHITDTKEDNRFFRLWRETWEKELYSPDMPQGAETVIRTLTQWWRDDGTDNVVKSLRYAYTNSLGKLGIGGNTADFLAWILTARDIARASAKFDDASLSYLRSIPQSAPYHLRRNTDDYAYKLQEFCTRLVKSAFGNDYDPADTPISTGRKALFNRLALYDAATALAEYWAKEGIRKAGKQCPAERCKACELHDKCKTLKSTTKDMSK